MLWSMLGSLFNKPAAPSRPRAAERFSTVGLRCVLGDVMDLSVTGVRVRCPQNPGLTKGDSITLAIQSESQSVRVAARVAWIRRAGLRGATVGLQFVNVRPGIAAALEQLGRYGFITADQSGTSSESAPPASDSGSSQVRASIEVEDLYAMLGVAATAQADEIKRAYHKLALELHPDRNPSAEAAEQFASVAKAYKVLHNETLRRKYDEMLARCGITPRP